MDSASIEFATDGAQSPAAQSAFGHSARADGGQNRNSIAEEHNNSLDLRMRTDSFQNQAAAVAKRSLAESGKRALATANPDQPKQYSNEYSAGPASGKF